MNKLQFIERFGSGTFHADKIHQLIDDALSSDEWTMRVAAARSVNATSEHLDKALADDDEYVRAAAACNPNMTKEHLDKALDDKKYWNVRLEAAKNPNATKEHLDRALKDVAPIVRDVAYNHPRYREFYPN